jgi:hypothetical protein
MERVIILGRGGAGKSTAAIRLGELTHLPVVELDKYFWRHGPTATPKAEWVRIQDELSAADHWIMDGDLGPYDELSVRLKRADTVIVLDFPFVVCALRAARRSAENADFWWWVFTWRWASKPKLMRAIATYAAQAKLHVLRTPKSLDRFLCALNPVSPISETRLQDGSRQRVAPTGSDERT